MLFIILDPPLPRFYHGYTIWVELIGKNFSGDELN
jgi:hypothetical protein